MTFDSGAAERNEPSDGATDAELGPDPRQLAREQFISRVAQGYSAEDAGAEHLNMLANAAMRGDKRVIVEGDSWTPYRPQGTPPAARPGA